MTTSPVDWYAARAGGIVAYLLITAVVVSGSRSPARRARGWPRFTLEHVHRFGGLLVGSSVGLHVVAIAIDAWPVSRSRSSSCPSCRARARATAR